MRLARRPANRWPPFLADLGLVLLGAAVAVAAFKALLWAVTAA